MESAQHLSILVQLGAGLRLVRLFKMPYRKTLAAFAQRGSNNAPSGKQKDAGDQQSDENVGLSRFGGGCV